MSKSNSLNSIRQRSRSFFCHDSRCCTSKSLTFDQFHVWNGDRSKGAPITWQLLRWPGLLSLLPCLFLSGNPGGHEWTASSPLHDTAPEQWTGLLCSVTVITANKVPLQISDQLIGSELLTSCFLENLDAYFQFPGGKCSICPPACGRPWSCSMVLKLLRKDNIGSVQISGLQVINWSIAGAK